MSLSSDTSRFFVYAAHVWDLVGLLCYIALVKTDCVNPEAISDVGRAAAETLQHGADIRGDSDIRGLVVVTVEFQSVLEVLRAPDVGDGPVVRALG